MLAFLIVQLALAAPHATPPADQAAPPPAQEQTPVGDATEQKGETPATTTQANAPSPEAKPANGARAGMPTPARPGRAAVDTSAGGPGAAATATTEHKARRHRVRRKRRRPNAH